MGLLAELIRNIIAKLISWLKSKEKELKEAAEKLSKIVVDATKQALEVHSPSRVFFAIGKYLDMGLINGINAYMGSVRDSGEELGDATLDSMKAAIQKIALADDWVDAQPTIRPVMDLTDIQNGYKEIGALFSQQLGMSASYDMAQIATRSLKAGGMDGNKVSEGSSQRFDDMVDEIRQLRSDMGLLARDMSNLRVVMDTGALVGAISPEMDAQLGRIANYKGRGI